MRKNIDDLLKPYADEQPAKMSMESSHKSIIERIPRIVDEHGVTREFQKFYDDVVDAVTTMNSIKLWEMSDKVLTQEQFLRLFDTNWKDSLKKIVDEDPEKRGIDIELNLSRFQGLHRNLIGGFYIMTYRLTTYQYQTMFDGVMDFEQNYTELLFTYKCGKFVVMSKLDCFKSVDEV